MLPDFMKDFKKLQKNYPTLKQDLKVFVNTQLTLSHKLNIQNSGIVRISGLSIIQPQIKNKGKKQGDGSLFDNTPLEL